MYPTEIRDWLAGGPWRISHESIGDRLEAGGRAELFTIYPRPQRGWSEAHELAHLIIAQDHQIFDPTWGYNEFIFGMTRWLSRDCSLNELLVCAVQYTIMVQCGYEFGRFGYGSILSREDWPISIVGPYSNMWEDELRAHLREHGAKWASVPACWAELQRKYALIRERNQEGGLSLLRMSNVGILSR